MEISTLLSRCFLFSGIDESEISCLIKANPPMQMTFKRGEIIFSSESEEKMVGFVLSGRCEIRIDKADGNRTLLNVLSDGDSFGVLSVYSADEFPTQIFASKNCEILFFTAGQIKSFVNNSSHISSNLINFLADRISFLNNKIATFSGNRVEDRLAAFLLSESDKLGCFEFDFNRQKTAERINAGRASVYRALASLENDGLISITDKKIKITDRKGLERITK